MARPIFAAEAWLDIAEILDYLGALNPAAAANLSRKFEATSRRLAKSPNLG
jgi:plasmid stabilization system protein ParE